MLKSKEKGLLSSCAYMFKFGLNMDFICYAFVFCIPGLGDVMVVIGNRYGVVAVRGAEVYELADEEGNLLNDPAAEKERVRARHSAADIFGWYVS